MFEPSSFPLRSPSAPEVLLPAPVAPESVKSLPPSSTATWLSRQASGVPCSAALASVVVGVAASSHGLRRDGRRQARVARTAKAHGSRHRGSSPRRMAAERTLHNLASSQTVALNSTGVAELPLQVEMGWPIAQEPAMPPELAAMTHAALIDLGDGGAQIPERKLKKKLGQHVYKVVRAEMRDCRSLLAAMAVGITSASILYGEVRAVLARAWKHLVASATSQSKPQQKQVYLREAATLLGHFLAGIPEEEARQGFEMVLSEWSGGERKVSAAGSAAALEESRLDDRRWPATQAHAKLEEMMLPLVFPEDLPSETQRLKYSRRVLEFLRKPHPQRESAQGEFTPTAVAEAVSIVAHATPELIPESESVLRLNLSPQLGSPEVSGLEVWSLLYGSPASLQIAFLSVLAERGGPSDLELFGDSAARIASLCAELAAATNSGSELTQLARGQVTQVLRQMVANCPSDVALALHPSKALALVQGFGEHLAPSCHWVLSALLDDMVSNPERYVDSDFFTVATIPDLSDWLVGSLAEALADRWACLEAKALHSAMMALPQALVGAPSSFRVALGEACMRHKEILQSLELAHFFQLIDAWSELGVAHVPPPFCELLHAPLEQHLEVMDPKKLVLVSQLLDDGNVAGEAEIVLHWKKWVQMRVDVSKLRGWGRCYEAIREVKRWQEASTEYDAWGLRVGSASLAEVIMQGAIVEGFCEAVESSPLEMGLELSSVAEPGGSAAMKLPAKLEQRIWQCLRGEDRSLSLALAIAIANNETPVQCSCGSKLWLALVLAVAAKLECLRDVDLFIACYPHPDFKTAVAQEIGGWIALELQVRGSA
mmetsp:Transcript_32860/g.83171  ORF Transcript_32860/g.83171 Transcript_32860/m.83171 type:complete len:831 (+) Transcript_32860:107-2599(+)